MFGEEYRKYIRAETGFDLILPKHGGLEELEKAITTLLAVSADLGLGGDRNRRCSVGDAHEASAE